MNKRATIQDVAELAGVSRAAVSKVLRNAYGISDDMRRRVDEAMATLNYRPQLAARALRGSTYTLGVLMPDMRNPFFPDILDGVWSALAQTQYQPLLGVRPSADTSEQSLIEMMLDHKLDGFIMIAPIVADNYLSRLAAAVPTVIIGRHEAGGGFDTVNNDDERGAHIAVEHLIAQGHERIAYFGFEPQEDARVNPVLFRLKGYLDAMRENGLARHIQVRDGRKGVDADYDRTLALELLRSEDRPSAVFAWSDSVALSVMSAADELGLRVPQDIAVIGYDNSRICEISQISLTSIDQNAHLLGEKAAELLIQRIAGREGEEHFVTPPRLVARRSSSMPVHRDTALTSAPV